MCVEEGEGAWGVVSKSSEEVEEGPAGVGQEGSGVWSGLVE